MIPASAMSRHASWNGPIGSLGSGVPITATRIAIPSTAPIWRTHPMIAPPVANRDGASSATDALPQAEKLRPTPRPVRNSHGRISVAYAGVGPTDAAIPSPPMPNSRPPGSATTRWPKRSASRPPISAPTAAMRGPGVTEKPAFSTE